MRKCATSVVYNRRSPNRRLGCGHIAVRGRRWRIVHNQNAYCACQSWEQPRDCDNQLRSGGKRSQSKKSDSPDGELYDTLIEDCGDNDMDRMGGSWLSCGFEAYSGAIESCLSKGGSSGVRGI